MTAKEKLLRMETYEEYEKGRAELAGLKPDKEVIEHLSKLFGKVSDTKEELYKVPRSEGGTIGDGLAWPMEKNGNK